jgi:hypothetical protein
MALHIMDIDSREFLALTRYCVRKHPPRATNSTRIDRNGYRLLPTAAATGSRPAIRASNSSNVSD